MEPPKSDITRSKKRVVARLAYQLEEKDGGFQLYRIILDEQDKMMAREKVSDPDAWEQTISLMEQELSRQFQ